MTLSLKEVHRPALDGTRLGRRDISAGSANCGSRGENHLLRRAGFDSFGIFRPITASPGGSNLRRSSFCPAAWEQSVFQTWQSVYLYRHPRLKLPSITGWSSVSFDPLKAPACARKPVRRDLFWYVMPSPAKFLF
ncbi:hypothetical protein KCP75_13655 [Salmonella enterica subsp. enterica]|nr:hypothetical protein KCP75_13655 [Salmonella enterica subsp. enterica]